MYLKANELTMAFDKLSLSFVILSGLFQRMTTQIPGVSFKLVSKNNIGVLTGASAFVRLFRKGLAKQIVNLNGTHRYSSSPTKPHYKC